MILAVEVASVGLFTQGRTRKQAEAMAADALEALAGRSLGASARSEGETVFLVDQAALPEDFRGS